MGLMSSLNKYVAGSVSKWLGPVDNRGFFYPSVIRDWYAGAWQNGDEIKTDSVASNFAVYSCVSLISNDIGKCPLKYQKQDADEIWIDTQDARISRILKKPNNYQNASQFVQWWITSKLLRGNAYALKERDRNGNVIRLYVLEPDCVLPLVSDSGEVFYQLQPDNLSGLQEAVTVPASEIIHDRMCCLFHPLVGISPLYASSAAALHGIRMQNDSSQFFANASRPGGILTAPGQISDQTAKRLSDYFNSNFTGEKSGKVAVVGDNLKFEPFRMTAVESQLIEQMHWSSEVVCATFHVPLYKLGIGPVPTSNNVEALTVEYYSQALQPLFNDFEICVSQGLDLAEGSRISFDLNALFKMDSTTQMKFLTDGLKGIFATNEARKRLNMRPVEGGDDVMSQQQNFSLAALAERDRNNPFVKNGAQNTAPTPTSNNENDNEDDDGEDNDAAQKILIALVAKGIQDAINARD